MRIAARRGFARRHGVLQREHVGGQGQFGELHCSEVCVVELRDSDDRGVVVAGASTCYFFLEGDELPVCPRSEASSPRTQTTSTRRRVVRIE